MEHFLVRAADRFGRDDIALMPEVMDRMLAHSWPGNVRELENCIERMVLMAPADRRLSVKDLPPALLPGGAIAGGDTGFSLPASGVNLQELEEKLIRQALERTRGALRPAANLLGISYKTLQYRIKKYGLERVFVPER